MGSENDPTLLAQAAQGLIWTGGASTSQIAPRSPWENVDCASVNEIALQSSHGRLAKMVMADLTGESSNSLFEVLEDWEAQLKPHEADLPGLEP